MHISLTQISAIKMNIKCIHISKFAKKPHTCMHIYENQFT